MSLDEYTLLETLGMGAFGRVKRALHIPSGNEVAIKIISLSCFEAVRQELLVHASLKHPHVISILDIFHSVRSP
jgi:serine/threonine protein kinase